MGRLEKAGVSGECETHLQSGDRQADASYPSPVWGGQHLLGASEEAEAPGAGGRRLAGSLLCPRLLRGCPKQEFRQPFPLAGELCRQ